MPVVGNICYFAAVEGYYARELIYGSDIFYCGGPLCLEVIVYKVCMGAYYVAVIQSDRKL